MNAHHLAVPTKPVHRVLVTGGAGFIGSHTVDFLLSEGMEVVVLDNLSSGKLTNLNLSHPGLTFIEGDILEYPLLEDLMIGCDAVLHLAAIASVPLSMEDPIYTFQVNAQGFLNVLQAVHRSGRPMRLVYASSAAVYGDSVNLPCRDDLPLTGAPLSPYALQKINNEEQAKLYARLHGTSSLGLRYFNVYGPRQDPHSPYSGVISHFMAAYNNEKEVTIFGDGLQSRDFIYVSDVVKANWLALQSTYKAHPLNVATGEPQTILHIIESLEAVGGKPVKRRLGRARPGDIKESSAAVQMALQHLQFRSSIPLKVGIKNLFEAWEPTI